MKISNFSGWAMTARRRLRAALDDLMHVVANWLLPNSSFNTQRGNLTWEKEPFLRTGRLPMSIRFHGEVFRWHNPKTFWTGAEFWRTFEDGPWKWSSQQRYAASNTNCGHFFSLAADGASAEAAFYKMDISKNKLLTATVQLDAILDLTYEDNLLAVIRALVDGIETIPDGTFFMTVLSWLTDEGAGGNRFTDCIGRWAHQQGYDGVLFFGARALLSYPSLHNQIENGHDEGMAGVMTHDHFRDMRSHKDLVNLVVLSGSNLTRHITSYSLDGAPRMKNVFFGVNEDELDKLLTYNYDYQCEMTPDYITVGRPIRVERRQSS